MRPLLVFTALCSALCLGCRAERELVYVSAEQGEQLVVIDPLAASVVERIAVGKRPRGLQLSKNGDLLYVAQSGSPRAGPNIDAAQLPAADRHADGIGVIELKTRKRLSSLPGGQDPESFAVSHNGELLYVANEETAELSVVDIHAARVVKRVPVGREPEGVTLHPAGQKIYVTSEADGVVVVIDAVRFSEITRIPTGQRPRTITFAADGKIAFVTNELSANVTVVDAEHDRVIKNIAISAAGAPEQRPMGAVLAPDGKRLFVSTGRGGSVAIIDVAKRELVQLIRDVGARPWGIAISPDGKRLYTANGPSDDVSIIDVASATLSTRLKVGGLPWGLIVAH
jgi:YVTN family beta-propeller protein